MRAAEFEIIRQVVKAPSPIEEKVRTLAAARKDSKAASDFIDEYLLAEVMRFEKDLGCVRREQEKLRRVLEQMTQPPLFPAVFLEALPRGLMVMLPGGAKRVIPCVDEIDPGGVTPGSDVLLNQDLSLVVATATETGQKGGEVGVFDRTLGPARLVLRHRDEEYVVEAVAPLNLNTAALQPGDLVRFDRGLMLAFEQLPRSAGTHFFETRAPKSTFADIGGLDRQIEEIKSLVALRFFHSESAARYGLSADGAILLEGPPGTGKTMLAGALAHWVGELSGAGESRWIAVKPGELRSEWYGVAERRVRECFQAARTAGAHDLRLPVVLFFDEVDSVASTRGQFGGHVDDRVMQAFAAELDGVVGRGNVLVIGATNRRQAIDPALLRPGRFGDKSITVPRPNMSAALAILEKQLPPQVPYYLNGHGSDVDAARADLIAATVSRLYAPNASASLGKLVFRDASVREVKASDLISGANLANIARAAREKACWREVAGEGRGLRLEDALAAIDQELDSLGRVLTPRNARDHIVGLPDDLDVIRIERPPALRPHAVHQYVTLS